jgi:hypothetical protein
MEATINKVHHILNNHITKQTTLYIKQPYYKTDLQRRLYYKKVHRQDCNRESGANGDELTGGKLMCRRRRGQPDGRTARSVS